MRIIGGDRRGLKLAEVGLGDAAAHLRPTADRVREAIFNLLVNGTHGNPIPASRVLDLFAGTGALGLEALSRGASHVAFVDNGVAARAILRKNIELMRAKDFSEHLFRDARKMGANRGAPFGLVFLDPPYGQGLGEAVLPDCAAGGWLAAGAMIVWEEGAAPRVPDGFTLLDQRRYGAAVVTLLRAPGNAEG